MKPVYYAHWKHDGNDDVDDDYVGDDGGGGEDSLLSRNHTGGTRLFLLGMRLEPKEKELDGEKKKGRERGVADTMLETGVW